MFWPPDEQSSANVQHCPSFFSAAWDRDRPVLRERVLERRVLAALRGPQRDPERARLVTRLGPGLGFSYLNIQFS